MNDTMDRYEPVTRKLIINRAPWVMGFTESTEEGESLHLYVSPLVRATDSLMRSVWQYVGDRCLMLRNREVVRDPHWMFGQASFFGFDVIECSEVECRTHRDAEVIGRTGDLDTST